MLTDFKNEIAGLEAGYLTYLHNLNELDRIESVFEKIVRDLNEMKTRLNSTNKSKL